MTSRLLFSITWVCLILSSSASDGFADETALSEGSAPAPIVSQCFPDRVHEFVWRNWNAVEPAKIAKILGASAADVGAMAESMGLPPAAKVPPEMKMRGYITLIRRNWHLLPYDQLLELLEMTPEQLDFVLCEDDFLWVKLGRLKPKCEPLRYTAPNEAARRRAAEIKRVVEEEFRGRQSVLLLAARFGGEGDQLPLASACPRAVSQLFVTSVIITATLTEHEVTHAMLAHTQGGVCGNSLCLFSCAGLG